MSMTIRSSAFGDGQAIPRRYSGDGEDISPPLSFAGLPHGTRELALIVDDPDAPRPEPWVHWMLYKVPADVESLEEGIAPDAMPSAPPGAMQGTNSWGAFGYMGPAPPRGHGVHHYHFRLFALDEPLRIGEGLDKARLLEAMRGHVLGQAELVGTYQR